MKVVIYASNVGGRLIFDTEAGTMILDCAEIGSPPRPAHKPKDSISGAYTAGELAQAWLDGDRVTGMNGKWLHSEDAAREEMNRKAITAWLKGAE